MQRPAHFKCVKCPLHQSEACREIMVVKYLRLPYAPQRSGDFNHFRPAFHHNE